MSKPELDNLVKIRKLKEEPPSRPEYDGMLRAGKPGCAMPRTRTSIPTASSI
jgi:hypothetical protein